MLIPEQNCAGKVKSSCQQHQMKFFLLELFARLDQDSLRYGVCGNYQNLPDKTDHDIDIWTENIPRFEKTMKAAAKKTGFHLYLSNKTCNGSNNFFFTMTSGGTEIVRIDLLSECAWRSFFPLVKSHFIEKDILRFRCFMVVEPVVETVMHLLYPLFNQGIVKKKYQQDIHAYCRDIKFISCLQEALGPQWSNQVLKLISKKGWHHLEQLTPILRRKVFLRTCSHLDRKRLATGWHYITTGISRLIKPQGIFIAFTGLDGAGKTTVIERVKQRCAHMFMPGKIKTFYWRPYLLPPLRKLMPFAGRYQTHKDHDDIPLNRIALRRGKFFSLLYACKFLYYWLDFILGRWRYQFSWSTGGMVLFDRYYYDHEVLPERFRFQAPAQLMKWCRKLVPQPDIIFFLYTQPEIICARKQEFPAEEIFRQKNRYQLLLENMPQYVPLDTGEPVSQTLETIENIILQHMEKRT